MSAHALRFHTFTLSFIPGRRERRKARLMQTLRMSVSTRRLKQLARVFYA